ncbi:hypothetical protein A15K_02463 [Escherichia coli KTE205]|nr:hypothetical protein A15K_02463 [Escherichia coli KTE205]
MRGIFEQMLGRNVLIVLVRMYSWVDMALLRH